MAKTSVADIVVPSVFAPYVQQQSVVQSALFQSGICVADPELNRLASGAGKTVDLPYWNDLTGSSEVLSDAGSLTPDKIVAGQDTAAINNRGKAWGANILTKLLAGDDPMQRIADLVVDFWNKDHQATLINQLKGLFDSAAGKLKDTHLLNIYADVAAPTDASRLTGASFIDATVKLGDQAKNLLAVCMHSDVEAYLRKQDLIDTIPDSEGKPTISVFQGRRVIVDDGCPRVAGVNTPYYLTFLFGPGAIGFGMGGLEPEEEAETSRDALASDNLLIVRRRFILHPRGVAWTPGAGVPAGASPTDAEFGGTGNWTKKYQDKNIRLVAVKHNV